MAKLSLGVINQEIARLGKLERRELQFATAAYQEADGRVWLVGSNVGSFGRVRRFLAKNLGVRDISEGNPGKREGGEMSGHFVPEECEKL